jgi:nucleotide-binding universal stress UspA family protein
MKILIAHDGSECADAALDDLRRAGLPSQAEAMILAVTDEWLPAPPPSMFEIVEEARQSHDPAELQRLHVQHSPAVEEATNLAERAKDRLLGKFPDWEIGAEGTYGSPASEIIRRSDEWKPDLIVVGSHGRTALGRFVLGSVSQKVLTEARTPVRIARGHAGGYDSPPRFTVGFDGSAASEQVIQAVAARNWPAGTEAQVIVVDEPLQATLIGRLIPRINALVKEFNFAELTWAQQIAETAAVDLRQHGLSVTALARSGDPKRVLVAEAEAWGADAIYLGSTGLGSRMGRFLLGSVSSAVAARAHCSVEVFRVLDLA